MRKTLLLIFISILILFSVSAATIEEEYVEDREYNFSSGIAFSGFYYNSASDSVILNLRWLDSQNYVYYPGLQDKNLTEMMDSSLFNSTRGLVFWQMTGESSGSGNDKLTIAFTITPMVSGSNYITETVAMVTDQTTIDGYTQSNTSTSGTTRTTNYNKDDSNGSYAREYLTFSSTGSTILSSSNPSVTYSLAYEFYKRSSRDYYYPTSGSTWTRSGYITMQIANSVISSLPGGKYVGTISVEVTPP